MKTGPEDYGKPFYDRRAIGSPGGAPVWLLSAVWEKHVDLYTKDGGHLRITPEEFDRHFERAIIGEEASDDDEDPGAPLAAIPALLSRLLAAGFDDVELALRSTRDIPAPTYRLIGYWGEERISWTQIFADEGDLERIEAAVLEKLEALKVERAAKGES